MPKIMSMLSQPVKYLNYQKNLFQSSSAEVCNQCFTEKGVLPLYL
jgi:hypothetical protein